MILIPNYLDGEHEKSRRPCKTPAVVKDLEEKAEECRKSSQISVLAAYLFRLVQSN